MFWHDHEFNSQTMISISDPEEYWEYNDYDIDDDFDLSAPPAPITHTPLKDHHDISVVWWISVFLCVFRSIHFLPDRAIAWLLSFLKGLFLFLGQYSQAIKDIAIALPASVYLLEKYMGSPELLSHMKKFVVCPDCHALYYFSECFDTTHRTVTLRRCMQVQHTSVPPCGGVLLKTVVTATGKTKHYPNQVYCYFDFSFGLKSLLNRRGIIEMCESVRCSRSLNEDMLSDVHTARLWQDFLVFEGQQLLSTPHTYAVLLNVDWFQPFKNINYSVGVIYLALLNLPRKVRYKRENIVLVGLIPEPSEPPLHINTYLGPLVTDLKDLWEGVLMCVPGSLEAVKVRCILLGVACDLPAGRKVCGFLSYSANKGCSRCYCSFSEGFGRRNLSDFSKELWVSHTNSSHRASIEAIKTSKSISEKSKLESEHGCRYSALLELPYFDPVRMLLIDPMHNLFLGTAKRMTQKIWLERQLITSRDLNTIHKRLRNVALPTDLGRLPVHIESGSTFTAQQWKNWVLYFSVMCVFDVFPTEHFKCWQCFVLACRRLCQKTLSQADLTIADGLLLKFCKKCVDLYGPRSITPNMHLHCHIRDFGPCHSFWLFSFERYNGILGKEPNNNRSVELQLMTRFLKDNLSLQFASAANESEHADYFRNFVFNRDDSSLDLADEDSTQQYFIPAKKSSIGYLSDNELQSLQFIYCKSYPELRSGLNSGCIQMPSSYHKFTHAFIERVKVSSASQNSKQPYVSALPTSPFTTDEEADLSTRTAEVLFFGRQVLPSSSPLSPPTTCYFVSVRWPKRCRSHIIGKPVDIWYHDIFDFQSENVFIAPQSIVCRLITLCD